MWNILRKHMFHTKADSGGSVAMRFDLTDLRLFLNVVEAGSITAGADRAYLALASASARVRGMEEELGVALLERGRRGVQPTVAGWTLVQHAKVVLHRVADMRTALGEHASGLKTQIRLLCNTAALTGHLPERLGPFLVQNPHVHIDLQEYASAEIVHLIAAGKAEVGIIADSVEHGMLATRPFHADQLVAVVARHHPLADRQTVDFSEVLGYACIGLMKGSALQDHLDGHAERLGVRINYRIRVATFEAICCLAGEGAGIGVMPEAAATWGVQAAGLRAVRLNDLWACRQLLICAKDFSALPLHTRRLLEAIAP